VCVRYLSAGETEFDKDVKEFWRAYTLRILPR